MSQKQHHKDDDNQTENGMVRGLQNRHVQLIAIAGTIGTGLFLGAGRSLSLTGPSIILVYILTGIFMYLMMRAIGEMLYMDPDQHTFINFITKYLGKGWGFFSGWSYWVSLIFLGMAEITAVSTYVQYWFPSWPAWQIQIIFLIILSSVNLIAVKIFGEVEFWFGMIKIITILALIATGIFMVATNFETPAGHADQFDLDTPRHLPARADLQRLRCHRQAGLSGPDGRHRRLEPERFCHSSVHG